MYNTKTIAAAKSSQKDVFEALAKNQASDPLSVSTWQEICEAFRRVAEAKSRGVRGSLHDLFFHYVMQNRKLAAAFFKTYFPKWNELFDFDGLIVISGDFFDEKLAKKVADIVYLVPSRDPETRPLAITIIVEHKAQSRRSADKKITIGNLMRYIVEQSTAPLKNQEYDDTPQALAVVVYSGDDPNYDAPKWEDYFPLPDALAEYALHAKIPCVNLTRLLTQGRLDGDPVNGNPIVQTMGAALACGGTQTLNDNCVQWTKPLQQVEAWDDDYLSNFICALFQYAMSESAQVNKPLTEENFNLALDNIDQYRGENMKNYWELKMEKYILEGEQRGKQEGKQEGKLEGKLEGKRDDITDWLLEDYGSAANALVEKINSISDFGVLKSILRLLPLGSLEEIERGVDKILVNA